MTKDEVMAQLAKLGSAQTKKTFLRHGAVEPLYGVKVGDLKTIQKKLKKNYELSLELYNTGNSDAMYLAGLIADENKMSKKDLNHWAKKSAWHMISEYTVAQLTAETKHGWELALEWIESKEERVAASGWSTLSNIVSITADDELDLAYLEKLMKRVEKEIHTAPNRVRYTMNGFILSVGCYVVSLSEKARQAAVRIGTVNVNVGDTACKVPQVVEYMNKVIAMKRLGKKRKEARC